MPASLAKWFKVPRGRTPKAVFRPTRFEATALKVPSPPPATMATHCSVNACSTAALICTPFWTTVMGPPAAMVSTACRWVASHAPPVPLPAWALKINAILLAKAHLTLWLRACSWHQLVGLRPGAIWHHCQQFACSCIDRHFRNRFLARTFNF